MRRAALSSSSLCSLSSSGGLSSSSSSSVRRVSLPLPLAQYLSSSLLRRSPSSASAMLRSLLARADRAASSSGSESRSPSTLLAPAATCFASHYSSKAKGTAVPAKKSGATGGGKNKGRKGPTYAKVDDMAASAPSAVDAEFKLPTDPLPVPPFDPALDMRPSVRPLFCRKNSFSELTHKDACTYLDFSVDELKAKLPEGLPVGMTEEFETRRWATGRCW